MNIAENTENKTENNYMKYCPYSRFWSSSAIMDFAAHNLPGEQIGLWTVNKRLDFTLKMAALSKLGYSRVNFER